MALKGEQKKVWMKPELRSISIGPTHQLLACTPGAPNLCADGSSACVVSCLDCPFDSAGCGPG